MIDKSIANEYRITQQVNRIQATHTRADAREFKLQEAVCMANAATVNSLFNHDRRARKADLGRPLVMPMPNEQLWLKARRFFVTASDASVLMNDVKSFDSIAALWQTKVNLDGQLHESDPEYKVRSYMENMRMWWGKAMEHPIALRLELLLHQRDVQAIVIDAGDHTLFIDQEYPWLAATIDRFIVFQDGTAQIAELKFPSSPNAHARWTVQGPPEYVRIQVAVQMKVCDLPSARVVALFPAYREDEPFVIEDWVFDRDDSLIEKLPENALRFIHCVNTNTKPHDWEFQ